MTNTLALLPIRMLLPEARIGNQEIEVFAVPLMSVFKEIIVELDALFPPDDQTCPRFNGFTLKPGLLEKIEQLCGEVVTPGMNLDALASEAGNANSLLEQLRRTQYHFVMDDLRGDDKRLPIDVEEFCRTVERREREYGVELRGFKRDARKSLEALRKYLKDHPNSAAVDLEKLGVLYNAVIDAIDLENPDLIRVVNDSVQEVVQANLDLIYGWVVTCDDVLRLRSTLERVKRSNAEDSADEAQSA